MSTFALRTAPARMLFWPMTIAAAGLTLAGLGPAALAPFVVMLALMAVLAAPVERPILWFLFLALILDDPGQRPADGLWQSPLSPVGAALYKNLHEITHIEALRFSGLEAFFGLYLALIIYRKLTKDAIDDPLGLGALPNPMKPAFAVMFGTVVFLEFWGLARGGDFRNSLWQLRQLAWLPLMGVVFGNAFKTDRARKGLLRVLMAAAVYRSFQGAYFYFFFCRPQGIKADYATTHSDSILSIVAIMIGITALVEKPSRQHLLMNLLLQPVLFMGLVVNNRRLAFVSLAFSVVTLVMVGPPSLLRFLKKSVVVLTPVVILYIAVGLNSTSGIFKPVHMIKSVSNQEDASSKTRDIENYNLVQTLKPRPLIGSGFGHEYDEVIQAFSVTEFFAQYRYIAHNSVLWIISIAGWLGFAGIWTVFPVALLLAFTVHRKSASPLHRMTAFTAVVALICFANQAWGDMGLQSWMGALIVTSLIGATGSLFTARQRQQHMETAL